MRRFILRALIFLIPFIALVFIEQALLPIDYFTFRVWEALKVDTLKGMLPGYFYPLKSVTKTEEGDLGHHTIFAVKKYVEWETDRFGYRNRESRGSAPPWDAVVVGDSNALGTGLTQQDTLAEVLSSLTGSKVYSFAPAIMNSFLKERRFLDRHPPIVILVSVEWDIPSLRSLKRELASPSSSERRLIDLRCAVKDNPLGQAVAEPLDRLLKANMLHYSRATLRRSISSIPVHEPDTAVAGAPSIRFLLGESANKDVPPAQFERAVTVILSYKRLFDRWGTRFIFLPIPNKENILYDMLPSRKKPVFVRNLIAALSAAGVETIDTQQAFEEAYRSHGTTLYQMDDSHWNREGVRLAARLLAERIRSGQGR